MDSGKTTNAGKSDKLANHRIMQKKGSNGLLVAEKSESLIVSKLLVTLFKLSSKFILCEFVLVVLSR